CGTMLRYALRTISDVYPIGTFTANMLGSYLLGFLVGLFIYKMTSEWLKTGLLTGLCGGFTTMSALASESTNFILNDQWLLLMGYLILTIVGGLFVVFVGYRTGMWIGERRMGHK